MHKGLSTVGVFLFELFMRCLYSSCFHFYSHPLRSVENGPEPSHLYTHPLSTYPHLCSPEVKVVLPPLQRSSHVSAPSHSCIVASILVALTSGSPGRPLLPPFLSPWKSPFVTDYNLVLWPFPSFLVHPPSPPIMSPCSGKGGLYGKSLILLENSLVGLDFNFFLVPPVIQTAPTQSGLTWAEY